MCARHCRHSATFCSLNNALATTCTSKMMTAGYLYLHLYRSGKLTLTGNRFLVQKGSNKNSFLFSRYQTKEHFEQVINLNRGLCGSMS